MNGVDRLTRDWADSDRWLGVCRAYTAETVARLRGSFTPCHSIASLGSERLWRLLTSGEPIVALGALTGHQAVQLVRAGYRAIYCSGWMVAGETNTARETYSDQGLYPADSGPALVERLNNALLRADQIETIDGEVTRDWLVPVLADAEAGFGGHLHAYETTRAFIKAGAAAIHLEDQSPTDKKCGRVGGKVLVPTSQFVRTLVAGRLAADVAGVPTVIVARTDALTADFLTTDADPADEAFVSGGRTVEGHFVFRGGIDAAIARGLAAAPYADVLWCETTSPSLGAAEAFARAIHTKHPTKLLAYNCTIEYDWADSRSDAEIAEFQRRLFELGYQFQILTIAGFHTMNASTFELGRDFLAEGMPAWVRHQRREIALGTRGYTGHHFQHEIGTSYFDAVADAIAGGSLA